MGSTMRVLTLDMPQNIGSSADAFKLRQFSLFLAEVDSNNDMCSGQPKIKLVVPARLNKLSNPTGSEVIN